MKGAESSFSNTFEKSYFVDPIFLKTEGNIKLGDARGKIVLLKDMVVVMNLEDIIISIGQIMRRLPQL